MKVRKKKIEGSDEENFEWIHVCTPTRDRIIAVANFYTYARYIVQVLTPIPFAALPTQMPPHSVVVGGANACKRLQ